MQLIRLAHSAEPGAHWLRAYRLEPVFARIGEAAIPQLLPLLDDPAANVRNFAVASAAMIRPIAPATIERLRGMLKDDDLRTRVSAAEALLTLGLQDENARSVMLQAARGSGEPAGDERALFSELRSVPEGLRSVPETWIRQWIKDLASDDSATSRTAIGGLSLIGATVVPALLVALKTADPATRTGAMEALQGMHLYRADIETAAMQTLKNDPAERARLYARQLLQSVMTVAARDALLQDEIDGKTRRQEAAASESRFRAASYTLDQVLVPAFRQVRIINIRLRFFSASRLCKASDGTQLFHRGIHRQEWRGSA